MCMDGGMYGWMSGGRTHNCVLPISISQRALLSPYLHARMHAYNACVVRASRHVFVSGLRPQGSGAQGSPEHFLLLLLFASLRLRKQVL